MKNNLSDTTQEVRLMYEGNICKTLGCKNAASYLYPEIEGYCSFDCKVTDQRKLKCPVCDTLMEYDSETAFFTCSRCGQRLRW